MLRGNPLSIDEALPLLYRLTLTQKELASALGCTRQTIYNWENGYAKPNRTHRLRIGDFLDASELSDSCLVE